MGKGILTGLLEDIKEGMEDIDSNNISNSKELKTVESKEVKTFDYSLVDANTAEFLHQKEVKITQIRTMSVIALGKELKEAHERLANNKTGTFEAWVESLGISHKTSRNYINAYNYMLKNFQHIENAEKIQPSLLFAVSKPSAPMELQEMVLSGDITTHKQYKELEEKLKKAEREAQDNQRLYVTVSQNYDRLEKANHDYYEKVGKLEKELEKVKKQLLEAQASGDSEEVEKLNILLENTVRELETSKDKIEELEEQLNDNTEIATAVVEKVPDEIYEELEGLRERNLSIEAMEANAEIKALLKVLNSNIISLGRILSNLEENSIAVESKFWLKKVKESMKLVKNISIESLKTDLFDFIKD